MSSRPLLLVDDISDTSPKGKRRSRFLRALAQAFADKLNADIDFLFVSKISRRFFKVTEAKADLKEELKKMQMRGRVHLRTGEVSEEILKFEEEQGPFEMLIMGTKGHSRLGDLFLGSVCEEVVRHGISPVLVLGPAAQEARFKLDLEKPLKVLVLTDLTPASSAAEHYAMSLCSRLGAHVVLFHSVGDEIRRLKESVYRSRYVPFSIGAIFQKMKKDASNLMNSKITLWQNKDLSVKSVLITEEVPMGKSLVREFKKDYDLIVMGTHGQKKVITTFIGSVARNVMLHSPVPVLIVRSL